MRTRQNESGGGMIELAVGPRHHVVTLLAGCREPGMRDRRCCRVVVRLMATHAGSSGDVVVVIDVTVRALARRHRVCAGQRDRKSVVEGRGVDPGGGVIIMM